MAERESRDGYNNESKGIVKKENILSPTKYWEWYLHTRSETYLANIRTCQKVLI